MATQNQNKNSEQNTGFSAKYGFGRQRTLNRDGSFNVIRKGVPFMKGFNLYDELMVISRWNFFFFIAASYVAINLIFTCLYAIVGFEYISGIESSDFIGKFIEVFFFSTQTFATVGYGVMSPEGTLMNILASFEAFVGLLSFAIATGLLYGRFSRPRANLIFSDNAVICPFKEGEALMFRFANIRKSEITDVEAEVIITYTGKDGIRKFFRPKLEIDKINFLTTSWTLVHQLNDKSHFAGMTHEEIKETHMEILILIKGYDDNFAQTISQRMSYNFEEIKFGYKFKRILFTAEDERTMVNLGDLNIIEKV